MIELDYNLSEYVPVIKSALENPSYFWRTVKGISEELSIPEGLVEGVLTSEDLNGVLIKSSKLSRDGEECYTTIMHFKNRPWKNRILSVLTDEVV